ncbi:hypothetical protein A3L11_06360 [Thermococcus siculi]|uniref:Uncharacterized protein n=1 Tax=Thermococcus siculi TaxID=72803 RepID=A0A2Z2MQE8_9EURY|nr:hypothetical protein [Thermococcus siculi]ASJ08867.1 hypothetical protein A3L11_06360 [Thermococcus siculi]
MKFYEYLSGDSRRELYNDQPVIENHATVTEHTWDDHREVIYFEGADGKIVSAYVKAAGSYDNAVEWVRGIYLQRDPTEYEFFKMQSVGSASVKFVWVPLQSLKLAILTHAEWGGSNDVWTTLDGVYVFNPLP